MGEISRMFLETYAVTRALSGSRASAQRDGSMRQPPRRDREWARVEEARRVKGTLRPRGSPRRIPKTGSDPSATTTRATSGQREVPMPPHTARHGRRLIGIPPRCRFGHGYRRGRGAGENRELRRSRRPRERPTFDRPLHDPPAAATGHKAEPRPTREGPEHARFTREGHPHDRPRNGHDKARPLSMHVGFVVFDRGRVRQASAPARMRTPP
jgi:hypothetical protein